MTGNWRGYGLFENLATNPEEYTIKNLGVVNFNIDVNYINIQKSLDLYAGTISGGMNNGTDIYNCYSKGGKINFNITGADDGDEPPHVNIRIGGICAECRRNFIRRCHSKRSFEDLL